LRHEEIAAAIHGNTNWFTGAKDVIHRGLRPAEMGGLCRRNAPCHAQQHSQNSAQGYQLAPIP